MPLAVALLAVAFTARPAEADVCGHFPPAKPVPPLVWGDLAPTDIQDVLVPRQRRSGYTGQQIPTGCGSMTNWVWTGLDIANGYLFTTYAYGFQIWDVQGAKAADPVRIVQKDALSQCNNGTYPFWPGPNEEKIRMLDVSVPAGKDSVAVTVGRAQTGIFIWDTTDKTSPFVRYQDSFKEAFAAHAFTTGGRDWAFVGTLTEGLRLYDLSEAKNRNYNGCLEEAPVGSPSGSSPCPGVYRGRLGSLDQVTSLAGVNVPGIGRVLVVPDVVNPRGIELWDVSSPLSPVLIGRKSGGGSIHNVAAWHQGGKTYVALRRFDEGRIYEVTSCLDQYKAPGQSCSFPADPVWQSAMAVTDTTNYISFSRVGDKPFLFFGSERGVPAADGRERTLLLDVSNPAQPVEISLNGTASGPCGSYNYWSWYDQYEKVVARKGKFFGDHFFRLGLTVFDVHELTGLSSGPPQANFTFSSPPSGIYPDVPGTQGTVVTLQDTSIGDVGSRQWVLPGQAQFDSGNSTSASPTIRFNVGSGPGTYAVRLRVWDSEGQNEDFIDKSISVKDPKPVVGSVSRSPASAQVCTPVTFTANNVEGHPDPTLSWQVRKDGATVETGGNVKSFVWDTAGVAPGTYWGRVIATNDTDQAQEDSGDVVIEPLGTLAFTDDQKPFLVGEPSGGTVTVSIEGKTTGATEWRWDLLGSGNWTSWSNDPVAGPRRTHTYTESHVNQVCNGNLPCTFDVRVQIRNCQTLSGGELTSETLQVTILELVPLKAEFSLGFACPFGCSVEVGQPFDVIDLSTGEPDQWVYKWNNTTSSATSFGQCTGPEEVRGSPKTSHTYNSTGEFYPCLEVRKSGNTDFFRHQRITVQQASSPPSITVSGPTSRQVGQQGTYSASASNCTPSPSGWSWSLSGSGGTIHSGQGSSSVTVSWSTSGTKQVRASNSACGVVQGSRTVSVSDGGGGGSVSAKFSLGFACPFGCSVTTGESFQVVDESTGNPNQWIYKWNNTNTSASSFNQCTGPQESRSSPKTQHTYVETGTFRPCLRVQKGSASDDFVHPAITVSEGEDKAGTCNGSDSKLCLLSNRFEIEVDWDASAFPPSPHFPDTGVGTAVPMTSETGGFYFFNPENLDLIVKVLDATGLNGNIWVFLASLSNIEFDVTVTDTLTDLSKTYHNPAHKFASIGDNKALPGDGNGSPPPPGPAGLEASFSFDFACPFGCTVEAGEELEVLDGSKGEPEHWVYRWYNTNSSPADILECTGEEELLEEPKQIHAFTEEGEFRPCLEVRKGDESDLFVFPSTVTVVEAGESSFRIVRTSAPELPDGQPFQTGELLERRLAGGAWNILAWDSSAIELEPASTLHPMAEGCDPEIHLCLRDGRFRVEVEWDASEVNASQSPSSGDGNPDAMTDETGAFWFFNPENLDLIVKVLDATGINGKYWVFYGALTNVEFWLTVTDTETGNSKTYYNPPHKFASRGDDSALPKD